MASAETYRIFLSSPGDVAEERARVSEAVESLNPMLERRGIRLSLVRWETHAAPLIADDPQDAVSRDLDPADCHIFLGIIWSRIGTPTPRAASGTVEEFELARRAFAERGVPRIMFYFSRRPVTRELDSRQHEQALRFKNDVKKRGLIAEYDDVEEFHRLVSLHLMVAVERLHERTQLRIAVEQTPPEEDGADDRAPDRPPGDHAEGDGEYIRPFVDVVDLRLRLEAKLTWLCKHLLAGPDTTTFATIGSLRYDGLLTDEQARVAARILTRTSESIVGEQPEDITRTLRDDTRFVNGFRASVFDGFVRQRIRQAKWEVVPFEQQPGHRPDFLAERAGGPTIRVSPRFAFGDDSKILARTVERLRGPLSDEPDEVARRMIVVPDRGRITTQPKASPQIIRYEDLAQALAG